MRNLLGFFSTIWIWLGKIRLTYCWSLSPPFSLLPFSSYWSSRLAWLAWSCTTWTVSSRSSKSHSMLLSEFLSSVVAHSCSSPSLSTPSWSSRSWWQQWFSSIGSEAIKNNRNSYESNWLDSPDLGDSNDFNEGGRNKNFTQKNLIKPKLQYLPALLSSRQPPLVQSSRLGQRSHHLAESTIVNIKLEVSVLVIMMIKMLTEDTIWLTLWRRRKDPQETSC